MKANPCTIYKEFELNFGQNRDQSIKYTKDYDNHVCGGVGEFFDIDPTIIRLFIIFFTIFYGFGLIAYLIGAVTIPEK
jgi:hypothetical protein